MVRENGGASDPTALPVPSSYGRYQLLKKLASGGMAEVYLARQQGLEGFQKLLVVKRILPHLAGDEEFVQMFLNEARIAARFNNPNIVQIYDLGKIDGSYFIGMEYVHGEDLGRIMRKAWNAGRWIPMPLTVRAIAQACEGLYYAHNKADDAGRPLLVVHRDISPQNILVSFDGGIKIVDFGIARAADSSAQTRTGTLKGKYAYMSPEQAQGQPVDCRTDIFALGLVLYELLTGRRPLKRDSDIMTLQAALACEIEPPSKVAAVTPDLDPVVMKALARDANDRYQTAREFQLALEDFLVQERISASSVHLSEFMSELFADRLEEEAKLGRPDPSSHVSQKSIPAMPAYTGPAEASALFGGGADPRATAPSRVPVPDVAGWDAPEGVDVPEQRGRGRRPTSAAVEAPRRTRSAVDQRPPPPLSDDDDDDEATSTDPGPGGPPPRRQTGGVRRPTGSIEARRSSSGSNVPVARPSSRSRSLSSLGGMPEAPPRRATQSQPVRDESWKEANKPRVKAEARERSSLIPLVAVLCVAALTGAVVFRADILRLLDKGAPAGATTAGPARAMGSLSIASNVQVNVEINGELVGQTPVVSFGVPAGKVKVRLSLEAQNIDRSITLDVAEGQNVRQNENFQMGNITVKLDRNVEADVFVNGHRIGQAGGAPLALIEGDYEFVARNEGLGLTGSARGHVSRERINFVTIKMHSMKDKDR